MSDISVALRAIPVSPKPKPNRSQGGSLTRLATSGNLLNAPLLHGRVLQVQEYARGEWRAAGELAVFPNTAFLGNEKLYNVEFHAESNSLMYSFGSGKAHRAGRLYFTEDQGAFIGAITGRNGKARAVRGTNFTLLYHTRRRLKSDSGAMFEPWLDLKIENRWEGEDDSPQLRTFYFLGSEDISLRTTVTNVNRPTGETTIEEVPDPDFGGKTDSFQIVLPFGFTSFKGTYTDEDLTEYEWEGTVTPATLARNTADVASFFAYDGPPPPSVRPSGGRTRVKGKEAAPAPTLSVMDLDNVTSVIGVMTPGGGTKAVDLAQAKTGEFFNLSLVNGLPRPWLDDLIGRPFRVPETVDQVFDQYKSFFEEHSYLAVGQMLYDTLGNDPAHKASVDRIKPDALKDAWEQLYGNETYATVSQRLYLEGYRNAVPGLRPYLENNPKQFALRYYQYLTSPITLGGFQAQINGKAFPVIKQQIYEWYVKLTLLDPGQHTFSRTGEVDPPDGGTGVKSTLGEQMLSVAYSALLGAAYSRAKFNADIGPFLQAVIENAANGSLDINKFIGEQIAQTSAAEMRDTLQKMIGVFDNIQKFGATVLNVLTLRANNRPIGTVAVGEDVFEGVRETLLEGSPQRTRWESFKATAPKVLGVLFYGAGAAALIYSLVQDARTPGLTPEKVIGEIGLGVLALGLVVKSAATVLSLGVGDWLRVQSRRLTGFLSEAAGSLFKWFTPEGVVPSGKLGRAFTALFGESYTRFFATRLGPALAVFGIVTSAVMLARAIETSDIRGIVFEAAGTFFALAETVFIGLELLSFAWAGPAGLFVAAVGLLVTLAQFIWNLVDPPAPPPDPIDRFISGPLKDRGFAS